MRCLRSNLLLSLPLGGPSPGSCWETWVEGDGGGDLMGLMLKKEKKEMASSLQRVKHNDKLIGYLRSKDSNALRMPPFLLKYNSLYYLIT